MKTILYNPIFINPQAYYVFPRLTRYLQPDNESTAEPANYIGTIEVKVIAYGDTTLKRTYTNTDSIDLSEFKNTWIRISLFTKVGSCVLGEWKIGNMESDLPYIDPEVLASLKAVVIVGNKTNNDSDRAIVKNLVDPDNPFVISNAAYTEGSGYADKDSPYYGAFVTDGVEDLITSTKTVYEMLGGSNEIMVVSMIHQIADRGSTYPNIYNNQIRYSTRLLRSTVTAANVVGKTGIYGYTATGVSITGTPTGKVVNDILGDKNDYPYLASAFTGIDAESHFSVEGYLSDSGNINETSKVAWYWTIIANKVLTTDQINQVIAYFNLDRTLNPDILCNTIKQGITNENHAEFGDKLIDFSGNGRDIQLNNIAWKGDSGIGKYETELSNTSIWTQSKETTCSPFSSSYNGLSGWIVFANTELTNSADMPSFKIQVKGLLEGQELIYRYYDSNGQSNVYSMGKDGEYTLPSDVRTAKPQTSNTSGFQVVKNETNIITITQIPSHAGALYLDGVSDFGKVTGMPIYKDYTFIIDRQIISIGDTAGVVASKFEDSTDVNKRGAFLFEYLGAPNNISAWSFYKDNGKVANTDFTRGISYQSTYSYNGKDLTIGTSKDSDKLWLGTIRDNDSRFFNGAIYSLMSFPYSMSEFLIERQLKKHKLGTLYPDMVEFRPVIKSNASYDNIVFYYKNEKVENGTYLTVGSSIGMHIRLSSSPVNEIKSITVNGIPATFKYHDANNNIYQYDFNLTSKSPQNINITIDEYIRFEDIKQPYPVIFQVKDRHTSQIYNYGDKIKVGSSIQLSQGEKPNLLSGLYSIKSYEYEGKTYSYNQLTNLNIILTKQSISLSCNKTWLLDDNEPKCILSPRLLSIPNSSYKILGYIPDISGHGNNGVINNSAYAEGSGVNEDGSYQFDGVDDFVTIPTVTGGKQVLMKVNWQSDVGAVTLYDQRLNISDYEFAIYNGTRDLDDNPVMAYQGRNNGQTYIDGILNSNIMASELKAITHNITITNELSLGINNTYPVIGSTRSNTHFAQMSLYDFMLFDEISTDDKIKELNEYVGIEAKVELPPYYWDTYGKTNLDADKATIQQRGVAVGNYDLTNYNHAYEGMGGYNGYPIILSGTNRTYQDKASYVNVVGDDKNVINLTRISFNTAAIFSYVKQNGELTSYNKDIESFKIKVTGIDYSRFVIKYSYISEANATAKTTMTIASDGIYELPKSFASDGSLTSSDIWVGINFTKQSNDIPDIIEDVNVTIEVLPEYENGLVYDGVEDFSVNKNIPIIDDFTVIAKRTWLEENISDKPFIIKGDTLYPDGNQNAFLFEYGKLSTYSFGQNNKYDESVVPSLISWATPTSYNGTTSLVKGSAIDTVGIDIAHATKMVFYKLILYPKTISLLEINFLKNLMEKDEIIDLTNPIFIQE